MKRYSILLQQFFCLVLFMNLLPFARHVPSAVWIGSMFALVWLYIRAFLLWSSKYTLKHESTIGNDSCQHQFPLRRDQQSTCYCEIKEGRAVGGCSQTSPVCARCISLEVGDNIMEAVSGFVTNTLSSLSVSHTQESYQDTNIPSY